jgi:hypothetical protein
MATLATRLENLFAAAASCNRGATAPDDPFEGMLWWDTDDDPIEVLKRYTVTGGWASILSVNITTVLVTLTSLRFTTPHVNEAVALAATSTELDAAADFVGDITATSTELNRMVGSALTTFSLGNQFTTLNAAHLVKIGNLVMFCWDNNAHTSRADSSSTVGIIPAAYRPVIGIPARIPNMNNQGYMDVYVSSAGTVSVYHRNQAGNEQTQTFLFAGSMVWYVA